MLKKFPYIVKDLLWALILAVIFILSGRPFLGFAWINNIIFIVFTFIAWRNIKLNNEMNFILNLGRISVLLLIIGIILPLVIIISRVFTPIGIEGVFRSLFDSFRLLLLLGLIIYGLQYYIFTLWKKELNFKTQKNLIFLEIAGLIAFGIFGQLAF